MTLQPPPPRTGTTRAVQHPMGRGGGALEASRDMETGQVASRAVPVPGPMADPGTRAAMADPVIRGAMANQGTPWAMVGSPPKKISLGKSTTSGGRSVVDSVSSWT